jgi:DNA-binding NtrC family response regulator
MYRILVVDDQATTATYIQAVLKTRGMAATVCGSAETAIQAFRKQPHDLVLTDLRMEPMDGLGLVRELRAMGSQVPVVVMTGYETLASAGESLKLGVFDYVTKPLEVRELLKTVTRALALSQATSGSVDLELVVPAHQVCEGMVALSGAMCRVIETIMRVADHDQCVLIIGEEGVGRHLAAQTIHQRSRRRNMPFVHITEATPAQNLSGKALAAMLSEAGTVFLDEVTRIALPAQEAIAGTIPDKVAGPAEGQKAAVWPRLVASSISDIPKAKQAGLIHASLAARLGGGATVAIPPLRERKEDLVPLFLRLLQRQCVAGVPLPRVEMKVFDLLELYGWPGNVGELEDAVRSMVRGGQDGVLRVQSLPESIRDRADIPLVDSNRDLETEFLKGASLKKFLREAGQRELRSRLEKAGGGTKGKE